MLRRGLVRTLVRCRSSLLFAKLPRKIVVKRFTLDHTIPKSHCGSLAVPTTPQEHLAHQGTLPPEGVAPVCPGQVAPDVLAQLLVVKSAVRLLHRLRDAVRVLELILS